MRCLFTARVRSTREGNVLTLVCLSVHGAVPVSHNTLQHFPECHGAAEGVPCQVQPGGGVYPARSSRGGYPGGGVPWPGISPRGGTLAGGVPCQVQPGGYPGGGGGTFLF